MQKLRGHSCLRITKHKKKGDNFPDRKGPSGASATWGLMGENRKIWVGEMIEVVLKVAFEGCPGNWQKHGEWFSHSLYIMKSQRKCLFPARSSGLATRLESATCHGPSQFFSSHCLRTRQILVKGCVTRGGPAFSFSLLKKNILGDTVIPTFTPKC